MLYYGCLTSDELGTGVLIDFGYVNDCAGLLGIAQRTQALLHTATRWAQSGDHGCLGVTTKALFQKPAGQNKIELDQKKKVLIVGLNMCVMLI